MSGGINLFVYVENNPVNETDPEGLWRSGPSIPALDEELNYYYRRFEYGFNTSIQYGACALNCMSKVLIGDVASGAVQDIAKKTAKKRLIRWAIHVLPIVGWIDNANSAVQYAQCLKTCKEQLKCCEN